MVQKKNQACAPSLIQNSLQCTGTVSRSSKIAMKKTSQADQACLRRRQPLLHIWNYVLSELCYTWTNCMRLHIDERRELTKSYVLSGNYVTLYLDLICRRFSNSSSKLVPASHHLCKPSDSWLVGTHCIAKIVRSLSLLYHHGASMCVPSTSYCLRRVCWSLQHSLFTCRLSSGLITQAVVVMKSPQQTALCLVAVHQVKEVRDNLKSSIRWFLYIIFFMEIYQDRLSVVKKVHFRAC